MSRLDSFLRRLTAQRDCLNMAIAAIGAYPGVIFELGLGNGRTFDHLRKNCPGREIHVFELEVRAHPDSLPAAKYIVEGDLFQNLPKMAARLPHQVLLVHVDLGSGYPDINQTRAEMLALQLPPLLAPAAVVVSDLDIPFSDLIRLPLPDGVKPGRYHMYANKG
jgi:hypothetical protein